MCKDLFNAAGKFNTRRSCTNICKVTSKLWATSAQENPEYTFYYTEPQYENKLPKLVVKKKLRLSYFISRRNNESGLKYS